MMTNNDINKQLINICELAVLNVKYDCVIRINKEGFLVAKEKKWMETTFDIRLGVNANDLKFNVDENKVINITIPDIGVIGDINRCANKDYKIFKSKKKMFSKNITLQDENDKIKEAKNEIVNDLKNNEAVIKTAENRLRELIKTIFRCNDNLKEYDVKFTNQQSVL